MIADTISNKKLGKHSFGLIFLVLIIFSLKEGRIFKTFKDSIDQKNPIEKNFN